MSKQKLQEVKQLAQGHPAGMGPSCPGAGVWSPSRGLQPAPWAPSSLADLHSCVLRLSRRADAVAVLSLQV